MGAGASSESNNTQQTNNNNTKPSPAAAPPPVTNKPSDNSQQQGQQQPPLPQQQGGSSSNRKPPMPPMQGQQNPPPQGRSGNEDDDDAAEWQREKERLAAKLKEKRAQEAAAAAATNNNTNVASSSNNNSNATQQQAPPPPSSVGAASPTGGAASDAPTSGGGNAAAPSGGDGKKKKKLLNGTNIEYRYPSGSTYVGGFKDGKLHGFGKYHYHPSGDEYEGEWFADMKHGQGTYTYEGGDRYAGEWRAGKKHGKGTYAFATGDEYVGNWKEDKIHGYGVFTIARNGNRYEGNWEESYRHGQGKLVSGSGDVYEGNWCKGKEDGLGVLAYANGNLYAGEWKAGQMDGKGILREKGQKYTVEHIAGYVISKVPVEPDQTIDPDWGSANRLYAAYTKTGTGGGGGGTSAGGDGTGDAKGGAGGGVSDAAFTKLKLERDMWEKKYMDLVQKRSGPASDNAEDPNIEKMNDINSLRQIALSLREQRDGLKLRADELEARERVLRSEVQELNFVADGLRKELAVKRTAGADSAESDRLQRRVAELERELATRKNAGAAGGAAGGKADDPVELKVRLELAEGELKNLRATRDEVYKLREQNVDHMKTIQGLEVRNEELIKEMNLQRAKASNLQSQIAESTARGAKETQDEMMTLRNELQDAQVKLAQAEDRAKKLKRQQELLESRARRADDLEAEVMRLSKLKTGDAELNKNLDKKMDQLDSLRRQNAELQRQVEELQHDLQNSNAVGSSSPKKSKKKNRGGDDDEYSAGGAGGGADAAVEQLQADLKKEKKKHKKAAADRDALAQELFEEQVKHARVERTLQNLHGRVNVVARVRPPIGREPADASAVLVNQDDPSQMIVMDEGNPIAFQFDTCIGPEQGPHEVFDEIKNTIAEVPDGYHTAYVFLGPLATGKSTLMQSLVPLALEELYNQLAIRHHNSIVANVQVGCVELTSSGAFDCVSGIEVLSILHDPKSIVSPVGVTFVGCTNAIDAAGKIKAISAKRQKDNGRSHLWIQVRTELIHKVHRTKFVGKLTLVDLCGPGALSAQESDIESGKFANRSFQAIGGIIDALQTNSPTVPYTDHVSTMLLSDVLGGNAFTTMIACLSPADEQLHDSVQTLQLANKATNVFNRPLVQHYMDSDEVRLREMVSNLASDEQSQVTMSEISTIR